MLILHGTVQQDCFVLWAENSELFRSHQTDELEEQDLVFSAEPVDEFGQSTSHAEAQFASDERPGKGANRESHADASFNSTSDDFADSLRIDRREPELLAFAATQEMIRQAISAAGIQLVLASEQEITVVVSILESDGIPLTSSPMIGRSSDDADPDSLKLAPWLVPAINLDTEQLTDFLCYCLDDEQMAPGLSIGHDLRFWALAMRFAGTLVAKQQFIPGLRLSSQGAFASWDPVFIGEDGERLSQLVNGMPGSCLAGELDSVDDSYPKRAFEILAKFINQVANHLVRCSLQGAMPPHTVPLLQDNEGAGESPRNIHQRWIEALVGPDAKLDGTAEEFAKLSAQIAEWRRPIAVASDAPYRLCLRLEEPIFACAPTDFLERAGLASGSADFSTGNGVIDEEIGSGAEDDIIDVESEAFDVADGEYDGEAKNRYKSADGVLMSSRIPLAHIGSTSKEAAAPSNHEEEEVLYSEDIDTHVGNDIDTEDDIINAEDDISADFTQLGGDNAGDPNDSSCASSPWYVRFLLQSLRDPGVLIPIDTVLSPSFEELPLLRGGRVSAREYLFRSLGQAVRLCPDIEKSFADAVPSGFSLDTSGAYQFLSQTAPSLKNAGFSIQLPSWWTQKEKIKAKGKFSSMDEGALLGLHDLAKFNWQLALGGVPVSIEELEKLAQLKIPLIRWQGMWVELNPDQITSILKFFKKNAERQNVNRQDLIKMALGGMSLPDGVEFDGITGEGRMVDMIKQLQEQSDFEELPVHHRFRGELRPYQIRGMSWLMFLKELGFGACLADDMGLGKTIQTLAFVQKRWYEQTGTAVNVKTAGTGIEKAYAETEAETEGVGTERGRSENAGADSADIESSRFENAGIDRALTERAIHRNTRGGNARTVRPLHRHPTLLVCPTSVIGNWQREAHKFTPDLDVLVHHGSERFRGAQFANHARQSAIVVTSYTLLHKDYDDLNSLSWDMVILDEAQNVKNPETNQAIAACSLRSQFRVALTGTPVENSVGDLWSLMNFLNPGLLGNRNSFKEQFFKPIQIFQDQEKVQKLRRLTGPFILRRLKTDKSIVSDLPEKFERKTRCHLTKEQASLYAAIVAEATEDLDTTTGMRRKSIVLGILMRLKQVCDHPALILKGTAKSQSRSGKLKRLTEMLESVLANKEHALIFTQFAQMGEIIQTHLENATGKEVLFLHGSTSREERERMVEKFQSRRDGPQLFVLSLKAGGTGLNLTRANHVFHFDRWWNPAVENQATDRAFRIGQAKDVSVHKFICAGTLEENIDEIIERKKVIASNTIGAGEGWLTELSTRDLRNIFSLRESAFVD